MTSINSKMGLKPAGKRQATHGKTIVSNGRCPKCGGRQVFRCQSKNAAGLYMCGPCGHFWTPEAV